MSHFVPGINASGVMSQIAQNITLVAKVMGREIEEMVELQKGYSSAALAGSNSILDAENKMADVERQQGYTSFMQAGTELTTPIATATYRTTREAGISMFHGDELKEISADQSKIAEYKGLLHEGKVDAKFGPQPQDDAEKLESLRHKSAVSKDPNKRFDLDDKANLSKLKGLRGKDAKEDPQETRKLYRDIDKKLSEEEKEVNNRRESYNSTTERRAQYISAVTQSGAHAMGGFGKNLEADERKRQAELDSKRTIKDYAKDNQKSAADTAQQAFQNTSQLYAEQIRSQSDIARANGPA